MCALCPSWNLVYGGVHICARLLIIDFITIYQKKLQRQLQKFSEIKPTSAAIIAVRQNNKRADLYGGACPLRRTNSGGGVASKKRSCERRRV